MVVLAAAAAVLVGGLAAYTKLSMDAVEVAGLSRAGTQLNVLVVGKDSREGLSEEQLQALGTETVTGDRPDTMFVLATRGGRTAMLSFPRDLFVTRCNGQQGRLNGAYASGGPSCLVQTVANTSGVPVTHYVEVNFLGFMDIVDAVGGVSLVLDEPMTDRRAGIDLPAGCVELDGRQAIGFVRARSGGSDLDRIARQQRFLGELAEEITAPTTLLNPVRLFRVAGAGGRAITADDRLGILDLLRIARGARGFAGTGVATYTVPATSGSAGGASVLFPDQEGAEQLYARFRDGSVLAGAPEAEQGEPDGGPEDSAAPPQAGEAEAATPDSEDSKPHDC